MPLGHYSPTNICSTSGPKLIRGINGIEKKILRYAQNDIQKRESQFLETLSKKVAMTYSPTKLEQLRQYLQRIVTRSMDEVHTAWGANSRDCQTFKSNFVDGGGDRSHVARTKFVPGGSPNRRHRQERRALTIIYAKTSLSVN